MTDAISKQCIATLPLSAEALNSWSDNSDLFQYLKELFYATDALLTVDGDEIWDDHTSYARRLYKDGRQRMATLASDFVSLAGQVEPSPAGASKKQEPPNFDQDPAFGLMAKYSIAWSATVNQVLSESAFFSLPHVLESEAELECSTLLASRVFYKQALQVIRNFLEGVVAELFFCDNPKDFKSWRENAYRMPSFRGKEGMLGNLGRRGLLSPDLVKRGGDLYGELNGSIHGAEIRLIHAGMFTRNYSGHLFNYQRFVTWAGYLSKAVDFAIPVLKTTVDLWRQAPGPFETTCYICHNRDAYDILEKKEVDGHSYSTIECRQCGNRMTLGTEILAQHGIG